MCGRYTLAINELEIEERFSKKLAFKIAPMYNVCPSHIMPIIPMQSPQIVAAKWGISHPSNQKLIINAKSEGILEIPIFKDLISMNRCLIPADSFIEWDKSALHQPYRFSLSGTSIFSFAGLYKKTITNNVTTISYTIITTKANSFMESIHYRMPVILTSDKELDWLNTQNNMSQVLEILFSNNPNRLIKEAISTKINHSKANNFELLQPTSPQNTLFGETY
ncbi:MAG: SOS response-associated peptidase family protein [Bacteroidota bacterium]